MLPVGETRMRAHCHVMLLCERNGHAHGGRVTRVRAAGDVGRGDEWHQRGVVRAAFTEVAVEVECVHGSAAQLAGHGEAQEAERIFHLSSSGLRLGDRDFHEAHDVARPCLGEMR